MRKDKVVVVEPFQGGVTCKMSSMRRRPTHERESNKHKTNARRLLRSTLNNINKGQACTEPLRTRCGRLPRRRTTHGGQLFVRTSDVKVKHLLGHHQPPPSGPGAGATLGAMAHPWANLSACGHTATRTSLRCRHTIRCVLSWERSSEAGLVTHSCRWRHTRVPTVPRSTRSCTAQRPRPAIAGIASTSWRPNLRATPTA